MEFIIFFAAFFIICNSTTLQSLISSGEDRVALRPHGKTSVVIYYVMLVCGVLSLFGEYLLSSASSSSYTLLDDITAFNSLLSASIISDRSVGTFAGAFFMFLSVLIEFVIPATNAAILYLIYCFSHKTFYLNGKYLNCAIKIIKLIIILQCVSGVSMLLSVYAYGTHYGIEDISYGSIIGSTFSAVIGRALYIMLFYIPLSHIEEDISPRGEYSSEEDACGDKPDISDTRSLHDILSELPDGIIKNKFSKNKLSVRLDSDFMECFLKVWSDYETKLSSNNSQYQLNESYSIIKAALITLHYRESNGINLDSNCEIARIGINTIKSVYRKGKISRDTYNKYVEAFSKHKKDHSTMYLAIGMLVIVIVLLITVLLNS